MAALLHVPVEAKQRRAVNLSRPARTFHSSGQLDSDLHRRFLAAMHETAQWANANPDKSAEILAKYTKLDPALVRASYRAKFGETLTPAAIQPTIDLSAHYNSTVGPAFAGLSAVARQIQNHLAQ